MKIIYEPLKFFNFAFEYEFSYDILNFCRKIKDSYGWKKFNFYESKWRFNDPLIIEDIKLAYPNVEIDSSVLISVKEKQIQEEQKKVDEVKLLEIKNKKKSDLVIPGFKGELYDYQKIGVEFLLLNKGRGMLFDQPGLGKSSQSLGYIVAAGRKKSLVICPASVKPSWKKEIEKWTKLKSIILDSKTDIDVKVLSKYDVFIINYDSLKTFFDVGTIQKLTSTGKIKKTKVFKLKDLFNVFSFDCLIADEAQMIKELSAGRTRMTRILSDKVESVILLSGTPIMNRPKELFSMLNIIDKKTWGNFMDYTKRYCDGHYGQWGWECDGASNLDELRSRISPYFLRRLKKDVATELPPKRFIDIPVELEYEQKIAYNKAERNLVEFLRKYKGKTDEEIQKSMQAEKLVLLNSLRYTTSMGKIEAARDIINNLIENDEKVLVFSVYNEPLEILYKEFKKGSVMITGKTPQSERGEAVEKFQNDKNIKVFFGGTKSAGTGITLTAAANVIFLDFSWVPADHEQALDRVHRWGQKADEITCYQLYADKTVDEKMKTLLETKKFIADTVIDGREDNSSHSEELISELLKSFSSYDK